MKILSIGNSFSQDAQRYLHYIARANNKDLSCANLYIGGCSLKRHYSNILDHSASYRFEFNGCDTGIYISTENALKSNSWDYITLQQASHESFCYDKYMPYLTDICNYVKMQCPDSKILIHKTWAYPDNKDGILNVGYKLTEEMFADIDKAYKQACNAVKADGTIPSGNAMLEAYRHNKNIAYRDHAHASLGFGRYMLGLVWFFTLYGHIENFRHIEIFDEPLSDNEKNLAYKIASMVTK